MTTTRTYKLTRERLAHPAERVRGKVQAGMRHPLPMVIAEVAKEHSTASPRKTTACRVSILTTGKQQAETTLRTCPLISQWITEGRCGPYAW